MLPQDLMGWFISNGRGLGGVSPEDREEEEEGGKKNTRLRKKEKRNNVKVMWISMPIKSCTAPPRSAWIINTTTHTHTCCQGSASQPVTLSLCNKRVSPLCLAWLSIDESHWREIQMCIYMQRRVNNIVWFESLKSNYSTGEMCISLTCP